MERITRSAGLRDQVAGWIKKAFLDDLDGAPEKDDTFSVDDVERGDALPPWVALASSEAHCRCDSLLRQAFACRMAQQNVCATAVTYQQMLASMYVILDSDKA
jgi:hypothetical protein